jgi:hypothetical protein
MNIGLDSNRKEVAIKLNKTISSTILKPFKVETYLVFKKLKKKNSYLTFFEMYFYCFTSKKSGRGH